MRYRIRFAAEQGCDAIDPYHVDKLAHIETHSKYTIIDFRWLRKQQWLAFDSKRLYKLLKSTAEKVRGLNMSTYLKKSMAALLALEKHVQLAVNGLDSGRRGEDSVWHHYRG